MKINRYPRGRTNTELRAEQGRRMMSPGQAAQLEYAPYAAMADAMGKVAGAASDIGNVLAKRQDAKDKQVMLDNHAKAQSELKQNAKLAEVHNWDAEQLNTANRTTMEAYMDRADMISGRNQEDYTNAMRQQVALWEQDAAIDAYVLTERRDTEQAQNTYYELKDQKQWAPARASLELMKELGRLKPGVYEKEMREINDLEQSEGMIDSYQALYSQDPEKAAAMKAQIANDDSISDGAKGIFARGAAAYESLLQDQAQIEANQENAWREDVTGNVHRDILNYSPQQLRDISGALYEDNPLEAAKWRQDSLNKLLIAQEAEERRLEAERNAGVGVGIVNTQAGRALMEETMLKELEGIEDPMAQMDKKLEVMQRFGVLTNDLYYAYKSLDSISSAQQENVNKVVDLAMFHKELKRQYPSASFQGIEGKTDLLLQDIEARRGGDDRESWERAAIEVLRVREEFANNPDLTKMRLEQYKAGSSAEFDQYGRIEKTGDGDSFVRDAYDRMLERDDLYDKAPMNPFSLGITGAEDQMNYMRYEKYMRDGYLLTGEWDRAAEYATAKFGETHGLNNIDGEWKLQYRGLNGDSTGLREQFIRASYNETFYRILGDGTPEEKTLGEFLEMERGTKTDPALFGASQVPNPMSVAPVTGMPMEGLQFKFPVDTPEGKEMEVWMDGRPLMRSPGLTEAQQILIDAEEDPDSKLALENQMMQDNRTKRVVLFSHNDIAYNNASNILRADVQRLEDEGRQIDQEVIDARRNLETMSENIYVKQNRPAWEETLENEPAAKAKIQEAIKARQKEFNDVWAGVVM